MTNLPPYFSVKKAHHTQRSLSELVVHKDRLPKKVRIVMGVDVHYVSDLCIGAVAVIDYESLEILETSLATCNVRIP